MIEVSQETKDKFLKWENIEIRLTFSDGTVLVKDDLVASSFALEQTLCDEEQLRIGSVSSATFSVQTLRGEKRYVGLSVSIQMRSDNSEWIPLGVFVVTDDNLSDDRRYRFLKGFDAVYTHSNDDVGSWYDSIEFPVSLKAFRDGLFSFVGITQEQTTLVNDSVMLNRTIDPTAEALSFINVAKAICEINGVFGVMSQSGRFRYVDINVANLGLLPANDLYPDNDLYPKQFGSGVVLDTTGAGCIIRQGSYKYTEYDSLPIDKLCIKESESDYGTIVGDGNNAYQITGNFLVYGNTAEENRLIANNILSVINGITYTPTNVTVIGMPWLEVGDVISVAGKKYTMFPILHRILTGVSACVDQYEAKGNEKYNYSIQGSNGEIRQLRSRTLELKAEVGEVSAKLTEVGEDLENNYTTTVEIVAQINGGEGSIHSALAGTYQSKEDMSNYDTSAQVSQKISTEGASIRSEVSENYQTIDGMGDYSTTAEIAQQVSNGTGTIGLAVSGKYQSQDGMSAYTKKAEIIASVNADTSGVKINADKVNITGYVTFDELSDQQSQTFIHGGNIKSGTITVDRLKTTNGILIDGNYIEFQQEVNALRFRYGGSSSYGTMTLAQVTSGSRPNRVIAKLLDGVISYDQFNGDVVFNISGGGGFTFSLPTDFSSSVGIDGTLSGKTINGTQINSSNQVTAKTYISSDKYITAGTYITASSYIKATGSSAYVEAPHLDTTSGGNVRIYYSSRYVSLQHSKDSENRLNVTLNGSTPTGIFCKEVITSGSSRVIKDNIEDITEEDGNKILELRPVEFDLKWGEHKEGMIAEEVREIYPNLVYEPDNFNEEEFVYDPDHFQNVPSLDYTRFTPYIIKLCQNQQKQIDELKAEVQALREIING